MKITRELTPDLAQRVLIEYAETAGQYNKSWAYWAYDAGEGTPHEVSPGVFVTVVAQGNDEYDSYGSNGTGYVVFRFLSENEGEEQHFKVDGYLSSYDSDWNNVTFTRVKGISRTVVVWE